MEANETDRVRRYTSPELLAEIDRQIAENVQLYSTQPPDVIARRIAQLEREWSMERHLERNASTLALTGVVLGLTVNRKWLLLSAAVLGFFLQHSIQGWCPPIGVLRRFGIRTRTEIEREKYALKALRGDFDDMTASDLKRSPERILEALAA